MFEHRTAPLLPASAFRWRLARHGTYAVAVLTVSLLVGTVVVAPVFHRFLHMFHLEEAQRRHTGR